MVVASWQVDSTRGWAVVIAGAVGAGVAFGTVYTFGAFFDAMVDDFGVGRGPTALVFGVTLLAFFGTGLVLAPLADRLGPRRFVLGGAVLLPLGLVLTSRVDSVVGGYVTYGVGVGIGGSLVIAPLYTAAGGWIVRRRALALGVLATGNGLGTLILVPFAERLIDAHGWRDAYVILARGRPRAHRHRVPRGATTSGSAGAAGRGVDEGRGGTTAFRRLFLTTLVFSVGLYVAFGFVVDFAKAEGIESGDAALLVGLIGAASIVGRLGLTTVTGRISAVRLLQGCLAVPPVAFVVWLFAGDSYPLLVLFALLLGVGYGGFVALGPEVALGYFGVVGLGGVMGLIFLAFGLGGLIGPPFGGWLADASDGSTIPIGFAVVTSTIALGVSLTMPTGVVAVGEPALD